MGDSVRKLLFLVAFALLALNVSAAASPQTAPSGLQIASIIVGSDAPSGQMLITSGNGLGIAVKLNGGVKGGIAYVNIYAPSASEAAACAKTSAGCIDEAYRISSSQLHFTSAYAKHWFKWNGKNKAGKYLYGDRKIFVNVEYFSPITQGKGTFDIVATSSSVSRFWFSTASATKGVISVTPITKSTATGKSVQAKPATVDGAVEFLEQLTLSNCRWITDAADGNRSIEFDIHPSGDAVPFEIGIMLRDANSFIDYIFTNENEKINDGQLNIETDYDWISVGAKYFNKPNIRLQLYAEIAGTQIIGNSCAVETLDAAEFEVEGR